MIRITSPAVRFLATTAFVSCLAVAGQALAETGAAMTPQQPAVQNAAVKPEGKKHFSPEEMAARVEKRIGTLHDKLKITKEQEPAWTAVAQTMRDNESAVSQLIQERHKQAKTRTAVEDLESYQKIAQMHADGLKKLIASFETLYQAMPADQKKVADDAFGHFEGRRWGHGAKKASTGSNADVNSGKSE